MDSMFHDSIIQISGEGLQAQLVFLVAAVIFIAAGLNAVVLSWLRSRDRLLLWLGVLSLLYGTRLSCWNRLVMAAFDIDTRRSQNIEWVLTCVILIPGT